MQLVAIPIAQPHDMFLWHTTSLVAASMSAFTLLIKCVATLVDPDSNSDGIPDWWMIKYFGHPTAQASDNSRATDDADSDGQNNLAEFLSGTDPTNGASALQITLITWEGNNVRITWPTAGGRTNIVQGWICVIDEFGQPSDPSYSNEFFDLSDLIIISGSGDGETNFVDDGTWLGEFTNWPARYYRIRLVP